MLPNSNFNSFSQVWQGWIFVLFCTCSLSSERTLGVALGMLRKQPFQWHPELSCSEEGHKIPWDMRDPQSLNQKCSHYLNRQPQSLIIWTSSSLNSLSDYLPFLLSYDFQHPSWAEPLTFFATPFQPDLLPRAQVQQFLFQYLFI